jgi:hypothetical protein
MAVNISAEDVAYTHYVAARRKWSTFPTHTRIDAHTYKGNVVLEMLTASKRRLLTAGRAVARARVSRTHKR